MYSVKEIFYTLQGEGANAGTPAVFCRFAGCNLWSGREEDRATAACDFCDTDFVGTDGTAGGKFATAGELADAIAREWPHDGGPRFVVCTGGEPLLQLDAEPARYERLAFRHFFLQPMDGPNREENTQRALAYCLAHPQWRLSLQTHKLIGIP